MSLKYSVVESKKLYLLFSGSPGFNKVLSTECVFKKYLFGGRKERKEEEKEGREKEREGIWDVKSC